VATWKKEPIANPHPTSSTTKKPNSQGSENSFTAGLAEPRIGNTLVGTAGDSYLKKPSEETPQPGSGGVCVSHLRFERRQERSRGHSGGRVRINIGKRKRMPGKKKEHKISSAKKRKKS